MVKRIVIAGSCRTPVGKFNGRLKNVEAHQLLADCFRETISRTQIRMQDINSAVAATCINSPKAMNVARVSVLMAALPEEVANNYRGRYLTEDEARSTSAIHIPAFTAHRNCGSGVQAIVSAVQEIKDEDSGSEVILVGGTESMSNSPMILARGSAGYKMRDAVLMDSLFWGLKDPLTGQLMGLNSENTVNKWGISREDQDKFALRSHRRAYDAIVSGKFESQIVPVKSIEKGTFGDIREKTIFEDEGPIDPDKISVVELASLKPYFKKGGTITAANSSSLNDGAASCLVMSYERAQELGIIPEAEIISYSVAACDPSYMGEGPILAIPKALKRAGLSACDLSCVEVNEAFASIALAAQRNFEFSDEVFNIHGGAVSLGHPIAATGMILLVKAINILKDMQKDFGLISLCIGGGQGIALVIKRFV